MTLPPRSKLPFAPWLALWLGLAALVCWLAWPQQVERGCWLGEWPFEAGCEAWPAQRSRNETPEVYQRQVQANVGDAQAYARLTHAWWSGGDPRALELLAQARRLAPYDPRLLAVLASASLQRQDWPLAAETLVQMVERGNVEARKPLLALMLDENTQGAVLAQLNAQSRWLDVMLATADPKTAPVLLQRFVSEGHALGIVRTVTVLNMVDRLKRSGDWMDAYTLWVAVRQKVESDLSNPGFDQRSLRRGFDWEWPQQPASKQGMRVSQVPASPRAGLMLEVELTARAALPQALVSQTVLLLAEKYRLKGRYMSDRMRTKQGLAWVLRCGAGGERWAQTPDLTETQRQWQGFEIEFTVPQACYGVARLQLEAAAPWEARAGISGVMYFDDFELSPVGTASTND